MRRPGHFRHDVFGFRTPRQNVIVLINDHCQSVPSTELPALLFPRSLVHLMRVCLAVTIRADGVVADEPLPSSESKASLGRWI